MSEEAVQGSPLGLNSDTQYEKRRNHQMLATLPNLNVEIISIEVQVFERLKINV